MKTVHSGAGLAAGDGASECVLFCTGKASKLRRILHSGAGVTAGDGAIFTMEVKRYSVYLLDWYKSTNSDAACGRLGPCSGRGSARHY